MPPKKTDDRTIERTTLDLGEHYKAWKDNEKLKEADKARFFKLCTEIASEDPDELDEILVTMWAFNEDAARARAERYNPRFFVDAERFVEGSEHSRGVEGEACWEFIMVLKPEYMPMTFINAEDGMVYQRQVVKGSMQVDDDRIQDEEPAFFEAITFELPWGDRILRPLDKLKSEELAFLQDYLFEGRPTAKLAPPRPATEEELESVG